MLLRRLRYKWRTRKSPYKKRMNLKASYYELIMNSKDEMLYQLDECGLQENLLKLLFYGKELKEYQELLLQVSIKYEFLGRMTYIMEGRGIMKPEYDEYAHYLVEGFQESVEEVRWRLESLAGEKVSCDTAKRIFMKFMFVMKTIIPCMALNGERIYTEHYRIIIEYAIEHDELGMKEVDNMWSVFPLKKRMEAFLYARVFGHLPEELAIKLKNASSEYGNVIN